MEHLLTRTKAEGNITVYNDNKLTEFRRALATYLGLSETNVWIISLRPVPVDTSQ